MLNSVYTDLIEHKIYFSNDFKIDKPLINVQVPENNKYIFKELIVSFINNPLSNFIIYILYDI